MGDLKLNGSTSGTITVTPTAVAGTNTITLPASTGTVALTASPTFSGTLTATTITSPASTALTIQSAGTTAMTVDTSQNVAIGTPYAINASFVNAKQSTALSGTNNPYAAYYYPTSSGEVYLDAATSSSGATQLVFRTYNNGTYNNSRFDYSGNLLVGTTSAVNGAKMAINSGTARALELVVTTTANTLVQAFDNPNGTVGGIYTNGTATSYSTSSDYRLKNDIQPINNGLTTVAALKPVSYKWNVDNSYGEGFIAHELQAIIPLSVNGDKDAVDADGNPIHQGVDYSKIVVHLVAAIQELSAKNDALEARLAALEAK